MPSEDLTFQAELSELGNGEFKEPRDLEAELFNRRTVKDLVTNLEKELGLNPSGNKKAAVKRHAVILSPNKDEDQQQLETILNDDAKFRIVMWKDSWTVHGDFKLFLIYEEFLDTKKGKK